MTLINGAQKSLVYRTILICLFNLCQSQGSKLEKEKVISYQSGLWRVEVVRSSQMPIEYSGDLNSRLVWILNGSKEVGLQMIQISNGIWNPEAQPFEIQTKMSEFRMVWLSNG